MAKTTVKLEGLRDVEAVLKELPKAAAKGVMRRVLTKRAKVVAEDYRGRVRVEDGDLRDSIGVSTKLSRRQKSKHRSIEGKATVEVFVGAGPLPQAITEEFGTVEQAAHPALRPAWDANQGRMVEGIKDDMWDETKKTAARRARKLARAAARG